MNKDGPKLGFCPDCGKNRDLPGIGIAHLCRPRPSRVIEGLESAVAYAKGDKSRGRSTVVRVPSPTRGIKPEKKLPVKLKGKTVVVSVAVKEVLQEFADAVKKRGRPKTRSPEDEKAYQREWKRKKRAAAKEGK